ncbi:MAG: hypothetical protein R3B89_28310 [Polyangiaceae bacterium]
MKKLTLVSIGLALLGLHCSSDDDGGGSGGSSGTAGTAGSGGSSGNGGSSASGGTAGDGGSSASGGAGGSAGSGGAGTGGGGAGGTAGNPSGGTAGTSGGTGGSSGSAGMSSGGAGGTGGTGGSAGMSSGGTGGTASCKPGEFGPNCETCTCVNGSCDDGITGTGACTCDTGWTDTKCDACAADYFGSTCQACGCGFGSCDDGLTGTGDCCVNVTAGDTFNDGLTQPSSTFTVGWDVTPGTGGNSDVVVGLSQGAVTGLGYSSMAVLIRFNSNGDVDARNGGTYTADASYSYTAGTRYHVRAVVNNTAKTYTVGITAAGGSEVIVATDFAFRSEQSSASPDNWAVLNQTSRPTAEVCNFTIQ